MTGDGPTPLDVQRYSLEAAADALGKAAIGAERLARMLSADVGHTDSTVIYEENKLELHRYSPEERAHETPIFVVYALVNRPYILDLQPDRSVIRRLLEAGFVVYLVDWGEPSRLDRALSMADYVDRYIDNCVDAVCADAGVEKPHLLGYCMGGTMSVMYAATHDRVRTLTLMATPVAFEGTGGILERWATHYDPETAVETLDNLPAELLAFEFAMLDPVDNCVGKFVRLYENMEDEEFVENFARMEQWIRDGVDVAGEAFREFVDDIYRDNQLIEGEFELGGEPVDLADVDVPVQQILGEYDDIVPPESSKPLNDAVASTDERIVEFSAGHIGISVSSAAHEALWPDVRAWLAARDASERGDGATGAAVGAATANGHAPDVRTVRGIGPTYAERLGEAGIETTADLAAHDAAELAEIAETSESRVEDWLDQV